MSDDTPELADARGFGHAREGYAVEMDFAGFSFRSLTVETEGEAEMIRQAVEQKDDTSGVRVINDE